MDRFQTKTIYKLRLETCCRKLPDQLGRANSHEGAIWNDHTMPWLHKPRLSGKVLPNNQIILVMFHLLVFFLTKGMILRGTSLIPCFFFKFHWFIHSFLNITTMVSFQKKRQVWQRVAWKQTCLEHFPHATCKTTPLAMLKHIFWLPKKPSVIHQFRNVCFFWPSQINVFIVFGCRNIDIQIEKTFCYDQLHTPIKYLAILPPFENCLFVSLCQIGSHWTAKSAWAISKIIGDAKSSNFPPKARNKQCSAPLNQYSLLDLVWEHGCCFQFFFHRH